MDVEKQVEKPAEPQSSEFVDKILKEKKNAMERLRQLEDENKIYQAKINEFQETKMIDEKKFQELAESRKKEADEWKNRFEETQKRIADGMKVSAIKEELTKLGMDQKYVSDTIKLVDLNKVSIDNDTQIVLGAADQAKYLAEKFQPLFGRSSVGVDHSMPTGNAVPPLTIEEFRKLPLDQQKARREELYQAHGISRTK